MRRLLLASMLAGTLAACQAVRHDTASGRPEVTIAADKEAVRAVLIDAMIDRGFLIVDDTPYRLVMDRSSDNALANALLGSRWNPTVHARAAMSLTETAGATRIVASLDVVTNPGTAYERLTPFSNSRDAAEFQTFLQTVAARVEASE